MRDLYEAYLNEAPDLMPFYASPPSRLLDAVPRPVAWPEPLVNAVRAYNARIGLRASFDGTELVVATGQQPGLFSGPLYTVYKAITCIKLAREVEERSGRRCVPLFWAASEDHDFEEAATAHFLTKKDAPLSLTYAPHQDISALPMYRVPLEDWVHEAIDTAAREARKSELTDGVVAFLHESASASDSLCDWSVRILARLFRDTPLILFVPHLPEARRLQAEVLELEIRNPLESTQRLNDAGKALSKIGFQQQVSKADRECNFFLEVEGRRRKVVYDGSLFQLPEENTDFTQEHLLQILKTEPERFSANVALRPVVQQHLFHALAYVGGPSEIAYWGQLKGIFEQFRQPMPVVYPRARCVLTTTRLNKLMSKLRLTLHDLEQPMEQVEHLVFHNTSEDPSYQEVTTARADVMNRFSRLLETLKGNDPVAHEMAHAVSGRVDVQFERILDALARRNQDRVDVVRRQVERLQRSLVPWRKPQERVYTVVSFLFEHGWGLVARLLEDIDIGSFQQHEVEL
ncbi:MAG TPA: bacillithiol biosynthesis cysteine-adding enzyme BshC [Candidatus Hydrogenedentes bacterium]|nr:bacillithiol biosynthesis cysteine-adding enzyme BshC [Candidatus Hydrogenedentota bacterium]